MQTTLIDKNVKYVSDSRVMGAAVEQSKGYQYNDLESRYSGDSQMIMGSIYGGDEH